jgi:hypothetical protein
MAQEQNRLAHYGSISGSVVAILGLLWLLGEPHLKTYIDNEIEVYDGKQKAEDSKKVKLRKLLSDKMGVADDEVHIELGHQYKNEKALASRVDSLLVIVEHLEGEIKLNLSALQLNYTDIKAINKKLSDNHGLFH